MTRHLTKQWDVGERMARARDLVKTERKPNGDTLVYADVPRGRLGLMAKAEHGQRAIDMCVESTARAIVQDNHDQEPS